MFGYDRDTGSIPVQPVCASKNKGFVFAPEIEGQSISQRIVIIVYGRMGWHPGGFVYCDNIFILIEDIQRQRRKYLILTALSSGCMMYVNVRFIKTSCNDYHSIKIIL